jgi:hypothetical protein
MNDRPAKPPPIFAVAMLATGVYLVIWRPDTGAFGWFLRVSMIVIALLWLAVWWMTRGTPTDPKDAADDIIRMQKALYAEPHEFAAVRPGEIRGLDLDYYDRTQQFFATRQFKLLGDVEDVTATNEFPQMRTFVRAMTGDAGATQVAIYHLKMRGWYRLLQTFGVLPKNLKIVDLETELSDGSFIVTANTKESDTTGAVPRVARFQYPLATPPQHLLEHHREQVQQACIRDPSLEAVPVNTLDEMIASQHRLQAIKNAHKASFGYMDGKELRNIVGEDNDAVRDVAAELERRRREG